MITVVKLNEPPRAPAYSYSSNARTIAPAPAAASSSDNGPSPKSHAAWSTADANDDCSICLDELLEGTDVKRLPCGHYFHPPCIDKWLGTKLECPMCKKALPLPPPSPSSRARGPGAAAAAAGPIFGAGGGGAGGGGIVQNALARLLGDGLGPFQILGGGGGDGAGGARFCNCEACRRRQLADLARGLR